MAKVTIRVRNIKTGRYRIVHQFEKTVFLKDSEHLLDELFEVPVVIDSIFANYDSVFIQLTPAWNRKRKSNDQEATSISSRISPLASAKTAKQE